MELLANPIVAVRAALDSGSRVANRRTEGAATLVDVTTAASEHVHARRDDGHGPAALGAVGRAAREPRRHYVSRRVQRLRARRRRVAADELQHGVGLQGQRAAAPARRPLRARRRRRRLGRTCGGAFGAGARACLHGRCERGRAGRVAVVRQRRRQFGSARVRGSLELVRGADEPRVDGSAHRQSAQHGAGEARDRSDHLAPSLRSHGRVAHGDRRRPHDRHAGGQRRLVRGSRAAARRRRFRMR